MGSLEPKQIRLSFGLDTGGVAVFTSGLAAHSNVTAFNESATPLFILPISVAGKLSGKLGIASSQLLTMKSKVAFRLLLAPEGIT